MNQIENCPLDAVRVCPLNPRKRIHAADIEEMAESILEHGIIQPPIARELAGDDAARREIVFGQRRYLGALRARELARERGLPEVAEIPLIVREMTDRQVIEEAWVENLQRVDVSVREEAEGFAELLALRDDAGEPVYNQTTLAKKLGKSVAFLSQRLKLRHVPELLWEALEDKRVSIRHLELVGTIADAKSRQAAAKEILDPKEKAEPLSTRETARLIEEEYRVSLKGVAWDGKDAELVPVLEDAEGNRIHGGSCEDCPHRTGNVAELQGQLAVSVAGGAGGGGSRKAGFDPKVCMQPACFRLKEEAHWTRLQEEAAAGGARVLTEEEALRVFAGWGLETSTNRDSGLVALRGRPDYYATGHHGGDELRTWEEYLEGTAADREVVIARHPKTGSVLRLIDRERAIKLAEVAMKERGEVSPFANRPKPSKQAATVGAGKPPKGPQPMPDWQIERQVIETSRRAILLKVREDVNEIDGLTTGQLSDLVTGVLLEAVFEVDAGEDLVGLLELLGYTIPSKEGGDLAAMVADARFAIQEDTDPKGAKKIHVESWLVMLSLLLSYESENSPLAQRFLESLYIYVGDMREEARKQIVKADAERMEREKEALKAREAARKASKAAEKDEKPAKKAPKSPKKASKPAKKAAKSAKKAVSKRKPAPEDGGEVIWRYAGGQSGGIAHAYYPEDELRPLCGEKECPASDRGPAEGAGDRCSGCLAVLEEFAPGN